MPKITLENGQVIEISQESYDAMSKQIKPTPTPSDEIGIDYKLLCDCNFDKQIMITDNPRKKIFINQSFAKNSKFGLDCVFIKCKFGSGCIKNTPYWIADKKINKLELQKLN